MQLLLSYGISTLLVILSQRNFVAAQERMVRFLFNNGNAPSASQTCTWQDNALINEIFRYRYNRRYLRNNDKFFDESADRNHSLANEATFTNPPGFLANETVSRELQTFPRYCANNCAGYAAGRCYATNCIGYRRELKNESNEHHDRDLQVASCSTVMTAIQNKLNDLIWNNRVSSSCKSYISAPINKTCTEDVIYGVLESVKVWDVGNPSSPTLMGSIDASILPFSSSGVVPASSFSFCRSKKITIEAAMNPCVALTSFHMYYNNNWWSFAHVNDPQTSLPFSLYGNSGSQMNGMQWLNVGTYILDIKPDWWVWKRKRFVFTVQNC